jgi:hypothetical protein
MRSLRMWTVGATGLVVGGAKVSCVGACRESRNHPGSDTVQSSWKSTRVSPCHDAPSTGGSRGRWLSSGPQAGDRDLADGSLDLSQAAEADESRHPPGA